MNTNFSVSQGVLQFRTSWMEAPGVDGWAAFKVADTVTSFSGYGMGSYSFFNQGVNIYAANAFEVPATLPVSSLHDLLTIFLNGSGVFGTNMAYLSRRLDVATSSRHRVLCSTATLGKPSDFIYQLTGRTTVPITQEDDGSPAPGRTVLLAKDPGYDRLVELLKRLAALEGGRFLAFADSRKMVEHVVAATRRVEEAPATADADHDEGEDEPLDDETEASRPRADGSHRILPYRAGYEAEDAKDIQSAANFSRRLIGRIPRANDC